MEPSFFLRSPTFLALDLGLAVSLAWLLDVPFQGAHVLFLASSLVLFQHGRVWRWRVPSLMATGLLLSGALASALVFLWSGASTRSSHALLFLPLWLAPLPGHLVAHAAGLLLPRQPVVLEGWGRALRLARQALKSTPGCPYRPVPANPKARPAPLHLPLPRAVFGNRSLLLATPRGALPLFPEGPEEGMGLAVRRTLDLLLALMLAPLATCLGLPLVLWVLAASGWPPFYSQIRITRREHPFKIHKIRSMVREAEPDGQPVWPAEQDPRITPVGRLLRRLWLDELPQLLDVLGGSMSLVGPRPERPAFVKEFSRKLPNYSLRHQVKAGITGLSQVLGFTGNTSLSRRLQLDLRYIVRWSPWLDLKILAATLVRMARRLNRSAHVL